MEDGAQQLVANQIMINLFQPVNTGSNDSNTQFIDLPNNSVETLVRILFSVRGMKQDTEKFVQIIPRLHSNTLGEAVCTLNEMKIGVEATGDLLVHINTLLKTLVTNALEERTEKVLLNISGCSAVYESIHSVSQNIGLLVDTYLQVGTKDANRALGDKSTNLEKHEYAR